MFLGGEIRDQELRKVHWWEWSVRKTAELAVLCIHDSKKLMKLKLEVVQA